MPPARADRVDHRLTPRQRQCLEGFWQRKTAKEIGRELGITHYAVEKHLLAVRQQLGVSSSSAAANIVFEGQRDPTVRPYYDAPDLLSTADSSDAPLAPAVNPTRAEAASDRPPINTLGAGMTLLAILGVAVGSILALAALIAAAQGANQLWRALGQ